MTHEVSPTGIGVYDQDLCLSMPDLSTCVIDVFGSGWFDGRIMGEEYDIPSLRTRGSTVNKMVRGTRVEIIRNGEEAPVGWTA